MPHHYGLMASAANEERDGSYIRSEYFALFRLLVEGCTCNLINRIDPKFWCYTSLDGSLVQRYAPKVSQNLRMASTVSAICTSVDNDADEFADCAAIWPLTATEELLRLEMEELATARMLTGRLPIRLLQHEIKAMLDVFVVGQQAFFDDSFEECEKRTVEAVSVSLCAELGVTFAQVRWIRDAEGVALLRVGLLPVIGDGDRTLLRSVAEAIAQELTR